MGSVPEYPPTVYEVCRSIPLRSVKCAGASPYGMGSVPEYPPTVWEVCRSAPLRYGKCAGASPYGMGSVPERPPTVWEVCRSIPLRYGKCAGVSPCGLVGTWHRVSENAFLENGIIERSIFRTYIVRVVEKNERSMFHTFIEHANLKDDRHVFLNECLALKMAVVIIQVVDYFFCFFVESFMDVCFPMLPLPLLI